MAELALLTRFAARLRFLDPPLRRTARARAGAERVQKLAARARSIQEEVARLRLEGATQALIGRAQRRAEQAVTAHRSAVLRHEQPAFRAAMRLLGSGLVPADVLLVAYCGAGAVAGIFSVALLLWQVLLAPTLATWLLMGLVPTAALTLATFAWLLGHPERVADRRRHDALGAAPEAIQYLVMGLRRTPALDQALRFSAENTPEPLASELRRVLWSVSTRAHPEVEDAFLDFAREWGQHDEDFARALQAVRAATLERTEEGLDRTLEKASNAVHEGVRIRARRYAAGLGFPTTILFAIGVLLPMVFGAMLPFLSLAGGGFGGGLDTEAAGGPSLPPWAAILLLDVVFPATALAYATHVLSNRPPGRPPPDLPGLTIPGPREVLITGLILGVGVLLALPMPWGVLGLPYPGALVALVGVALAAGYLLSITSRSYSRRAKELAALEADFPDGLFQLGSRIGEGVPVERAFAETAVLMGVSPVAILFTHISTRLRLTRADPATALFGADGILVAHPSRLVRGGLRTVLAVTAKDAAPAGRTILRIAADLREQERLAEEVRQQLRPTVGMMEATALFFAPLVMGVTAGLYTLLHGAFGGEDLLSPPVFRWVLGIYLMGTVTVTTHFAAGVAGERGLAGRAARLARALPISIGLYGLALLITGILI